MLSTKPVESLSKRFSDRGSTPLASTKHPKNPLFKRVFALPYTFFTRFICEKAFLNDLIQHFDGPFFLLRIEMGVDVYKRQDERLLSQTGGIVQGMSGSPLLQNGKIVGAVTHVFVNDPTKGYGIYVDWMLNELGR